MANKPLKPQGVVSPKGTNWLNEVRIDAARNTTRLFKEQAETAEFEEQKANGITVEEIISQGQKDLVDKGFLEVDGVEEDKKEVKAPEKTKEADSEDKKESK